MLYLNGKVNTHGACSKLPTIARYLVPVISIQSTKNVYRSLLIIINHYIIKSHVMLCKKLQSAPYSPILNVI